MVFLPTFLPKISYLINLFPFLKNLYFPLKKKKQLILKKRIEMPTVRWIWREASQRHDCACCVSCLATSLPPLNFKPIFPLFLSHLFPVVLQNWKKLLVPSSPQLIFVLAVDEWFDDDSFLGCYDCSDYNYWRCGRHHGMHLTVQAGRLKWEHNP